MNYKKVYESLVDRLKELRTKGIVLEMGSREIGSLVCCVAAKKISLPVIGVSFRCEKEGLEVFAQITTPEFEGIEWTSRLKIAYLKDLAEYKGMIMIDTRDQTDFYLGTEQITPIFSELWKSEVVELGKWMSENVEGAEILEPFLPYNLDVTTSEILQTVTTYKKNPTDYNLYSLNRVTDKYGEEKIEEVVKMIHGKMEPVILDIQREPADREIMRRIKREN